MELIDCCITVWEPPDSALFRLADKYGLILDRVPWDRRLAAGALLFQVASLRAAGLPASVEELANDFGLVGEWAEFASCLAELSEEQKAKVCRSLSYQILSREQREEDGHE